MSKHSRKPNRQQLERHQRNEHRQNFYNQISNICKLMGHPEAFKLIPRSELEDMYISRLQTVRLKPDVKFSTGKAGFQWMKHVIAGMLKLETVEITTGGPRMPIGEYLTTGVSFRNYLTRLKNDAWPGAEQLKKAMKGFFREDDNLTEEDCHYRATNEMHRILQVVASILNGFDKPFIWFDYKLFEEAENGDLYASVTIKGYLYPETHFMVNGISRPALRVDWPQTNTGMENLKVKPSDLGIKGSFASIPLEVYIQRHALLRLEERLEGLDMGMVHWNLFLSLRKPKAIRNKEGKLLIELVHTNMKIGYLKAIIIEGKILLQTFLFLTNSGTPEGEKLEELCGLAKADKKYLAIDKISTFMVADIISNDEVYKLFIEAGCGSLFEFYENLHTMVSPVKKPNTSEHNTDLNKVAHYLGLMQYNTATNWETESEISSELA